MKLETPFYVTPLDVLGPNVYTHHQIPINSCGGGNTIYRNPIVLPDLMTKTPPIDRTGGGGLVEADLEPGGAPLHERNLSRICMKGALLYGRRIQREKQDL